MVNTCPKDPTRERRGVFDGPPPQEVGSITLAALPAEEDELLRRSHAGHRARIFSVCPPSSSAAAAAAPGALLIMCEVPVPAERAHAFASALGRHVAAERTLVVASMPVRCSGRRAEGESSDKIYTRSRNVVTQVYEK